MLRGIYENDDPLYNGIEIIESKDPSVITYSVHRTRGGMGQLSVKVVAPVAQSGPLNVAQDLIAVRGKNYQLIGRESVTPRLPFILFFFISPLSLFPQTPLVHDIFFFE